MIKTASGGKLVAEPKQVVFDDVKPGVLYVMTISLRNTSSVAERIRLQAPKSNFFALNYIPSGPVAPGLDVRAEIEFQLPSDASIPTLVFRDILIASMGSNSRIEIPLSAIRPHTTLRYESIVNLGNILVNQRTVRELFFENLSETPCTLNFSPPKDSIVQLSTMKLELKAKGSDSCKSSMKISLLPRDLGSLREIVNLRASNTIEDMQMDISAKVVEQTLSLLTVDGKGELKTAEFGSIFFGESKTVQGLLVNSGPFQLSYTVKYEDEEDPSNEPEENESQSSVSEGYLKSMTLSPPDGIIPPFSQLPLYLMFAPQTPPLDKGFIVEHHKDMIEPKSINRTIRIECLDNQQIISVKSAGIAVRPFISLQPSMLRFGECPVHDRRDILLTLTNVTPLPTSFSFPMLAHFKFRPSHGILQQRESLSIIASFLPAQLGKFKVSTSIKLLNGLQEVSLNLVGASSPAVFKKTLVQGTDKLPEDFQVQHKFVDPEEIAQMRAEKKKSEAVADLELESTVRALMNNKRNLVDLSQGVDMNENKLDQSIETADQIMHGSQDNEELYFQSSRELSNKPEGINPTEVLLQRQRNNKATYNKFLQESRTTRELSKLAKERSRVLQQGAVDFGNPFGVNMGMNRGLDEPQLKLPTEKDQESLKDSTNDANKSGLSKLMMDENRLIQKKFSATPKTQAEVRDCSAELSVEQLKSIVASHKVIDFGRVSVGSLTAKNFAVNNSLNQAVLVSLDDLDIELQQSRALKQVIPANSIAGYDICFCSRALGKFKGSFTWKINGIHIFKVHIVAEVIPIQLVMSKKELLMEFPIDLLKPVLTSEILLTNPGNSHADFLWGNAGAFRCDPEKGTIPAGKSTVITVSWDPHCGKRLEEELGLHITGGVDQSLMVRGVLKETKAEFSTKRMNLGVMAVGTEREIPLQISNIGENPLVYFINRLDDQLGISVEPWEGILMPGEKSDITVKIIPKAPRSYDNEVITAKIRGGKNVVVKLNGSSIIPDVDLEPTVIDFGTIPVGRISKANVILRNSSPITATLLLDLSRYPDFFPRLTQTIEDGDLIALEMGEMSPMQEDEAGNQILLLNNDSQNLDSLESNNNNNNNDKRKRKKVVNNTWKIILQANTTLKTELVFKPSTPNKYSFRLPLNMMGISQGQKLAADVRAISVASLLSVSQLVINFNDRVVARDALARSSYFQEVQITNISSHGVSFNVSEDVEHCQQLDNSKSNLADNELPSDILAEKQQYFFVSPLRADLSAGATLKLRVTFQPQENALYHKKLHLIVKGCEAEINPYLTLLILGSGVYPFMTFSSPNIKLPTVPLNFTSRAVFTIYNNGYNALDLRHRVSPNITVPLEISYPDGNQLGIMIEKVRVTVSVKVDQPVSWNGKLEFYDQDGERFYISISGCSDNCLLTNYSFIKDYSSDYGFVGLDGYPVSFLPNAQIAELRAIEVKRKEELRRLRSLERQRMVEMGSNSKAESSEENKTKESKTSSPGTKKKANVKDSIAENLLNSPYPCGIDLDKPRLNDSALQQKLIGVEATFLLKWLNKNICRKPFDPDRFPLCILETNGELVIDCIELMSGKKLSSVKQAETSNARRGYSLNNKGDSGGGKVSVKSKNIARIDRLVMKLQHLINFLISNGALLSHVSPINLLNLDDSLVIQEYELLRDKSLRLTPALLASRRELWSSSWLENSQLSWLEVMYQSVKVFVLSRLTYKEYCILPGVVLSNKPDQLGNQPSAVSSSKGKKGLKIPPVSIPKELEPSNVYSHGESILSAWCSYHILHADGCKDFGVEELNQNQDAHQLLSFTKRVIDFERTFGDSFHFCQLVHSHITDITMRGEPLSGYTTYDRTQQQSQLFEMFEEALSCYEMGIDGLQMNDIISSGRNMLMLLIHLYLALPHRIPKAKVEFDGLVGESIAKKIELKNGSKKPLLYRVQLKGSSDFSSSLEQLTVAPESSADLVITLVPRFLSPVSGKLYCWNVQQSGYSSGTPLCFDLVSKVKGFRPREVFSKLIALYDLETFQLPINNPTDQDAVFQVRMVVKFSPKTIEDLLSVTENIKKNAAPTANFKEIPTQKPSNQDDSNEIFAVRKESGDQLGEDWDVINMFEQPFWFTDDSIVVPKRSSKLLSVYVVPFILGKYQCEIILANAELGEFSFLINADINIPRPSERLEINLQQNKKTKLNLSLNSKNIAFEKALGVITDMRIKNANKRIKARNLLQNQISSTVVNDELGYCEFGLSFTFPIFEFKSNVFLVSEYMKVRANTGNNGVNKYKKTLRSSLDVVNDVQPIGTTVSSEDLNKALLSFSSDRAGQYKTIAVIFAKENRRDIRCLEVNVTSKLADAKFQIDFVGPARKTINQEIPVTNDTDKEWRLSIITSGSGHFSAPKQLIVPPFNREVLVIGFYSVVPGTFEGRVLFKNVENGDTFEYALKGISEDPLAEDHLVFQCAAREKASFTVQLPKIGELCSKGLSRLTFEVETDLPYVNCADIIEVGSEGASFPVHVMCPLGGSISGMISFRDRKDTQAAVWYTVQIEITPPKEENQISVEAVVRKAAAISITLDNPTNEELLLNVILQGEGLLGTQEFVLPPNDRSTYELIYSPLRVGSRTGRISFLNDRIGEIWYKLLLTATPAPPVELGLVEAMLGTTISVPVLIDNPLPEDVTFHGRTDDAAHFSVSPNPVVLKPYTQESVNICFSPSTISEILQCNIYFDSKQLGEISYILQGTGLLPGLMTEVVIESPLDEISSRSVSFKNPFNYPLPVDVSLSTDGNIDIEGVALKSDLQNGDAFSLLVRRGDVILSPKSIFNIPVAFSPKKLSVSRTSLVVRASASGRQLTWCYPIIGTPEAGATINLPSMKTKSKTSLLKEHDLILSGIELEDLNRLGYDGDLGRISNEFTVELNPSSDLQSLVQRSFRFQLLEVQVNAENALSLRCRLLFEPLRIFTASVDIIVSHRLIGKWRAQVELVAQDPDPDDSIRLVAKVNGEDKVSFKLHNQFLGYSAFHAFFTQNSSPHFSVNPISGMLPPFDSGDGVTFTVTFSPREYGVIEQAMLIILTEDIQWCYSLKGSFPENDMKRIKSRIQFKS